MAGAAGGMTANPMQQASGAQMGALAGTAAGMAYTPQQVSASFGAPMVSTSGAVPMVGTGGTTPSVTAGQLSGTNIAAYQNPYTQQVIQANEADIMRGAQMGLNALGTQASRAGAFGGSRHGVAMGELGRNTLQQLAQSSAGLRQAGFQNAQQAAQFDIGQGMQAQMANQQAAANDLARQLQAQGMNQSAIQQAQQMGLQGQLANQAAGLQGAQQRLGAAAQLGNLGAQSFGYGQQIQQNLAQQGTAQQALNQALIDAAKAQYTGYQQAPTTGLSIMTQALGASPHGQSTTQQRQLGLMDYLTAGATIAGAMPSDVRLKKSIRKIGELANGIGIYTWQWTKQAIESGKSTQMFRGVLAQEVRKVFPDAVVVGEDGYMRVNYAHPELKGAI